MTVGDLPSSEHAKAWLADPSAVNTLQLGADLVLRAAIVAAGMSLFSSRSSSTARRALAGSAAIEIFVIAYTASKRGSP